MSLDSVSPMPPVPTKFPTHQLKEFLDMWCKKHKIAKKDIAERLGMSPQRLNGILTRTETTPLERIEEIADAIGVNREDIFMSTPDIKERLCLLYSPAMINWILSETGKAEIEKAFFVFYKKKEARQREKVMAVMMKDPMETLDQKALKWEEMLRLDPTSEHPTKQECLSLISKLGENMDFDGCPLVVKRAVSGQ